MHFLKEAVLSGIKVIEIAETHKERTTEVMKKKEKTMEQLQELFAQADREELKRGYCSLEEGEQCIVCGKFFERGEVYPLEGHFYDSVKMAQKHVEKEHGGMLFYLLEKGNAALGLSEVQLSILKVMAEGISDQEAAQKNKIAVSTMRNHRFKMREKERQARLFLAVMEMISEKDAERASRKKQPEEDRLIEPHKTASMVDDRYVVTEEEREKILKICFDDTGYLKAVPAREKKKLVVLRKIAENYKPGQKYTEKEINQVLKRVCEDYPYVRRLLIEYGFLERTSDGSAYWIKE